MSDEQTFALVLALLVSGTTNATITAAMQERAEQIMYIARKTYHPRPVVKGE